MLNTVQLLARLPGAGRPPVEVDDGVVLQSCANTLAAYSGGGQTSATVIGAVFNEFTFVAADNDSCVLPVSVAGVALLVVNASSQAKSLNVFPTASETINGGTGGAAVAVASGKRCLFFCVKAGNWYTLVTA